MDLFAIRRASLAAVARQFEHAVVQGDLTRPAPLIYQSFIHMHCNCFWDIDCMAERETLQLLLRTRTGLERSPVHVQP